MTSAVVPIRGMRRLRMTGTRTVGAGTTVEPAVGGRGVKAVAGEAASVAMAAAPAGEAPTAVAPAVAATAAPAAAPAAALRRDARGGGGGSSTFCVSSETGGGGACSSIAPGPGSSTASHRSCGGDRSRAGRCVRPVASRPVAVGARRGERRVVLGHRREHRQPGRRREGPGRRVGRHDREAPVVDDRLARQQPEVHPGGADPGSVRDHERDLRRLGASDPRGGGGDLVVDVEIDGARCHSGG